MFLELLRRRNPDFLRSAALLHQSGTLPANCFVIDLDAVRQNAATLRGEAERLNLTVFAMTKQVGRNPDVCKVLAEEGLREAVAVDLSCADAARSAGLDIGHLGHLVQIPRHESYRAAALAPGYWTVFSDQKAREAAQAATAHGRDQALLARVAAPGDEFYPGHEGGFRADEIGEVADRFDALEGAHFAGLTTFPALLFDTQDRKVRASRNLQTLQTAAEQLRAVGRQGFAMNAPGTTSTATLAMLAEAGATQVEPGHGLTGTTPWHAFKDLAEEPALAYVSEVSHIWNDRAFVFGGGLYVDPVIGEARTEALVLSDGDLDISSKRPVPVQMPPPGAIDYYATIAEAEENGILAGDSVIFGFRAQAFVTRALTAGVAGVRVGRPRVAGIWRSDGTPALLRSSAQQESATP